MLSEYSNSLNTPLYPTVPYCFNVLKSSIAAFAFGKGFPVFGILKYAPDDLLSLQVVLSLPLFPYFFELFPQATQGAISFKEWLSVELPLPKLYDPLSSGVMSPIPKYGIVNV